MLDRSQVEYPYIPGEKGIHPGVFSAPDGSTIVESGSGRSLIIKSSPTSLVITDGLDYIKADDFEIKSPRKLAIELTERADGLTIICELVTKIPEEGNTPHPDFFTIPFTARAIERFEKIHRKKITFLEGDCEEVSKSYQQYLEAQKSGSNSTEAFWTTSAGQGSAALGFTEVTHLSPYQTFKNNQRVNALSFRTKRPTPTP